MAGFGWKLRKPAVLALISAGLALGAIRPSFYLDSCGWNATDIVVLAPTTQAGTFRVLETIKGELTPQALLELKDLTPSQIGSARLGELSKSSLGAPCVGIPAVGERDRLIVFLRRPGARPEYNPRSDLPVQTSGWEPADLLGDLRTSTVWIQDGSTYAFLQNIPGPTCLTKLGISETQLRGSLQSVLLRRGSMDQAMANPDAVERGRQLAALVRSGNTIARSSAIEKLKRGDVAEATVLLDLLADPNLLGWHQEFIAALVARRATGSPFAQFLSEETVYWSGACPTLKAGWWNGMPYPEVETPRSHYTRAHALLNAIHDLGNSTTAPAVRDFAAIWSTCPPLAEHETDQIAEALKLLLRH
ncbi:hypothetical protein [Paludibaculum fermentans]|uniref:hypothetical protein n=1 Tax=Paludibaculum fermentans TaxID=1473598 RepID=UPI003EB79D4C